MTSLLFRRAAAAALCVALLVPSALDAQVVGAERPPASASADESLDSLVERAQQVNPRIRAARERLRAAEARVEPAGTLPDPMLGVGVMNFPVSDPGFGDFMTMNTVSVGQLLPYPGKLRLARSAHQEEAGAAVADLEAKRLEVATEVRRAYYEVALYDRALEILERNQRVVSGLIQAAAVRFAATGGGPGDALDARVEAAELASEAVALAELRAAAIARLNAALDRPSETPLTSARIPERIARAALPANGTRVRFTSAALGARTADSPLPPLAELEERAISASPELRSHEATIRAQASRVELARKDHLPDLGFTLQYGQRTGHSDMLSVMVSAPVPLRRARVQDMRVTEAVAELGGLQAGHHQMVNELRAEVARLVTELERVRTQLALLTTSVLPDARASLETATTAFQVGRGDLQALLAKQAALYGHETAYHRALSEFAIQLAELERIVGEEVLP